MPEGLRNFVAWTQFHIFVFRFAQRSFWPHAVVLQIAVAIFVDQNTAFTTATFGHQDTGTWQTRRVILNEFHITQWNAMAQRHTHAVTGYNTAVSVVAINATRTACSHNYCVSTDLYQRAFHHVHCHQAANMIIIDQNIQYEVFVKTLDLWEL